MIEIEEIRGGPMIVPPTVGPLWGSEIPARAEILEGDVWRALNRSTTGQTNDSPGYCRPSLGLGNTSQSRDPGGSTKRPNLPSGLMIQTPPVAPLRGSEIQPEPRSWRETSGEHKYVVGG